MRAEEVIGDVRGRSPVIVDGMITTGATIEAAARVLLRSECRPELLVAATHGLLVKPAVERIRGLSISRIFLTDSVPPPGRSGLAVEVVGIADMLADAIDRLHRGKPLEDLKQYT